MSYLLDANTLIQAKNEYYAFNLCPGFWAWLDHHNARRDVFSIDRVRIELERGSDELATWASARGDTFFLPIDDDTNAAMRTVSAWVMSHDYRDDAKRLFLSGADPFLIAYALAHDHSIATHEVHVEGERRKVKIPTVCRAIGVDCVRTFGMLINLGAQFDCRGL